MFTGIVEEVGRVASLPVPGRAGSLRIAARTVLQGVRLGDSIAVNGVCLTVTSFDAAGFAADVMPETLARSSLGRLRAGSPVNLERAMAADGRFGGHIVSGHIDGVGTVTSVSRDQNAVRVRMSCPPDIAGLIVEKGSVAIDGISLTVSRLFDDGFEVSVIPHTARRTTLGAKRVGDLVNLENDVVGKYVQRLLGGVGYGEAVRAGSGASPAAGGLAPVARGVDSANVPPRGRGTGAWIGPARAVRGTVDAAEAPYRRDARAPASSAPVAGTAPPGGVTLDFLVSRGF